jgi:hypothetical protein
MVIIMRTEERDLLKRVLIGDDDGDFFLSHGLYKEIQEILDKPEQEETQYLLDQVSRLFAENAMLKEKWSIPKREPLSDEEIEVIWGQDSLGTTAEFVRAIEKAHGIGVDDDK